MRRALELASAHRPHPNPRVGAVVLDREGGIVGQGAHVRPGSDHAERLALQGAPAGSTLVVTLEPCVHQGRTPPCTDGIIDARVRRVVVGALDPDPRVAGRGVAALESAGIGVEAGLLSDEVEASDPAYFHHRRTGRARITLKAAMTLDGQTAAGDGTSQWISSAEGRGDAHLLRSEADAVMVGAGTVRSDDPLLTVRLDGYEGVQPVPVVVAGKSPLPTHAKLWARPDTLVVSTSPQPLEVDQLMVPPGPDGLPDPGATAVALGQRGLLDVLLEGGATLAAAMWRAGVLNRGVFYLAPKLAGGRGRGVFEAGFPSMDAIRPVRISSWRRVGADLRVEFEIPPLSGDPDSP